MPRPLGSPNKLNAELREKIYLIIEKEFESIEDTLNELTAKERIEVVLRLLKFSLPQLRHIQLTEDKEPLTEIRVNIVKGDE